MLTTVLSPAAPEVVISTTAGAAREENSSKWQHVIFSADSQDIYKKVKNSLHYKENFVV